MIQLQQKMFAELRDKKIFDAASRYAYEYIDNAFERNVYPTPEAINQLAEFNEPLPENGTESLDVIALLNKYASPANVVQIYGRYFGFVNGSALPVSIAAKQLATYWDQNTAMFAQSPAAAKLEGVVEGWLQSLFNLPKDTAVGFVSGTSPANICALAAARYRLFKNQNWNFNENGFNGAPRLRIVAGREAHSSIIKSICLVGFGKKQIEFVDTDTQGRIIPEALPELDDKTVLILQAGNVNSGSFDNFKAICHKARNSGAWIHIDGAFGLWAAACDQLRHLTDGIEFANSWAADGHKTLNTPYDSGMVLCADREALTSALQASGDYFVISKERDGMFYSPEMSRRARIFEIWAALKYLGKTGLDQMIRNLHHRSQQFADELRKMNGLKVLNEVVFNQVLVAGSNDVKTIEILRKIQEDGTCWAGGSTWQGKKVIRISVCSWATTEEDVRRSVKAFEKAAS